MQDRLGRSIKIGDLVTIKNHQEVDLKVNWEIIEFTDYITTIEVTLRNFITGDIAFVSILDIQKEG